MIAWDAAAGPAAAGPAAAGPAAAGPAAARPELRPLRQLDFVIVDVETTGWSPGDDRITEIAAVRLTAGRIAGQFSSLVNPGDPIPATIAALTGISDAMVALAPPPAAVLPGFLAFARGCVLTAHNAPFDVAFLMAACQACGLAWPGFPVLDTVTLAHRLLPVSEVPDCRLATLADFFGARTQPRHRALADALATADVLAGLLARLALAGVGTLAGIESLADIRGEHAR